MSIPVVYRFGKVSQATMRNIFTVSGIYLLDKKPDHSGMTNYEIRLENARYLGLKEVGGVVSGMQARFAEKMGLSESRVSQIIGENPVKNIGPPTARRIEEVFGLERGWMDIPHPELWRKLSILDPQQGSGGALLRSIEYLAEQQESQIPPAPPMGRYIPVVGTVLGGPEGHVSIDDYPVGHGATFILAVSQDPNAYALEVRGDSMRPRMKSKDFLIVEPNMEAHPGNDVVVKLKNDDGMVKEWMYKNETEVRLGSTNDDYKAVTLPIESIESIHRVADIVPAGSDRIVTEVPTSST